jgi:hypothetical protein
MFLALHVGMPDHERSECFQEVRRDIARQNLNWNRVLYLITNAIVFLAVTLCIGIPLARSQAGWQGHLPAACLLAGGAGAFLSVLQRIHKLPLDPFETRSMVVFKAVARIVLGNAFGLLLYVAVRGDLLLGSVVSANPYRLLTVAVAAGVSERLIPELLERMEGQAASRKDKNSPPSEAPATDLNPQT